MYNARIWQLSSSHWHWWFSVSHNSFYYTSKPECAVRHPIGIGTSHIHFLLHIFIIIILQLSSSHCTRFHFLWYDMFILLQLSFCHWHWQSHIFFWYAWGRLMVWNQLLHCPSPRGYIDDATIVVLLLAFLWVWVFFSISVCLWWGQPVVVLSLPS
jgi:hypothetical protein